MGTKDQKEKVSLEGAENLGGRRKTQTATAAKLDSGTVWSRRRGRHLRNRGSGQWKRREKTETDRDENREKDGWWEPAKRWSG